ncbi:MAG TPA: hypothetical protein VIY68_08700 [Steroidobacteraceae bacterium]
MPNIELIVLARLVHVMAGVIWAGATFVLAAVILPIASRYGTEGAGRWIAMVARRVGPISGIAALLTVLSGSYLFAALHANDRSAAGLVLKVGAIAALLSLVSGFFFARPTSLKLARLSEQHSLAGVPPTDESRKMSAIRLRATLGSCFTAALLGLAVLSMASFRYAAGMI